MQSAEETLRQLDIDTSGRIDVYSAVEALGLWLVFQPLGGLLGAIVPHGTGGVIVTTQRGPGLQRFTAAHEIGHWRMDHDALALDSEDDILRGRDDHRERAAQIFAAYFLMPPPLVFATISRHQMTAQNLTAPDVYRLARDMGSSYEATARHLTNLDLISVGRRDELLAVGRGGAKAELTHGRRPAGDVWDVRPGSAGAVISLTPGDEVVLALPESPSTGYTWALPHEVVDAELDAPAPAPPLAGDCPDLDDPLPAEATPMSQTTAALASLPRGADAGTLTHAGAGAFRVVADGYLPSWATVADTRRPDTTRRRRIDSEQAVVVNGVQDLPTVTGAATGTPVAGVGTRLVCLRADQTGAWRIVLDYNRAFDPDSSQGQLVIRARVRPPEPLPYDITDNLPADDGDSEPHPGPPT